MQMPYAAVEFTKSGDVADRARVDDAVKMITMGRITDILVLTHGWNTGIDGAEELYAELTDNVDRLRDRIVDPARRFAVVGVLWPSVRWADDDQVAGGGLSVGEPLQELEDRIRETVADRDRAAELIRQAPGLTSSPQARAAFVAQLRAILPEPAEVADDDPIPETLRSGDVHELLARVAEAEADVDDGRDLGPEVDDDTLPPGGFPDILAAEDAAGTGFGLRDLDLLRAARQLLNLTTYFTMKDRAGNVGSRGVAELVDTLAAQPPGARVHLAGHSFGARVVSAAAASTNSPVCSISLLQGAFSHRGFASASPDGPRGAFRRVVEGGHVRGPVVITHTHNDRAVRLAYAVASRLAGQAASAIGDASDPYGGIGANGALGVADAEQRTLGDENARYGFTAGRLYNLRADSQITDHLDVKDGAVANVLLQAALAGEH